jgi:hypothetical protein
LNCIYPTIRKAEYSASQVSSWHLRNPAATVNSSWSCNNDTSPLDKHSLKNQVWRNLGNFFSGSLHLKMHLYGQRPGQELAQCTPFCVNMLHLFLTFILLSKKFHQLIKYICWKCKLPCSTCRPSFYYFKIRVLPALRG